MFLGLGLIDNLTDRVASLIGIRYGLIPNTAFKISYLLLNSSLLHPSPLHSLLIIAVYALFCLLYLKKRYHFYYIAVMI